MASRIEEYALLGDTESAALVSRTGSIDWLTFPRFDSPACFAALLGDDANGFWRIAPVGGARETRRHYRTGTLVLETEFTTADGTVALIDTMPPRDGRPDVVRVVEGRRGRVDMEMELRIRFDYGRVVPFVRRVDGLLSAVSGPDGLVLATPVALEGHDLTTTARFTVGEGDRVPFVLEWFPSHERPAAPVDAEEAIAVADRWWRTWMDRCTYDGHWADEVRASLVVLKAMTYAPTGGVVAAPTTSLPEAIGGGRNWDYRYCWLRDATFTLMAMLSAGFTAEAHAWRDWLLRAVGGEPSKLQIMYGPAGEARLDEVELPWLGGYEGSRPVRIGNAAHGQFQLDVWGEVLDALHQSRVDGLAEDVHAWHLQIALLDFLEGNWQEPDEGLWEVRGDRRHFTHSKVMAWVAFDRAVRAVEQFGQDGPIDRWRAARDAIHAEVCARAVDDRGVFVQSYGSSELDASTLMIPMVGFLPADDPRVVATAEAIAGELCDDGFVRRYRPSKELEGVDDREGAFLLCTFWLADNWALMGRVDDAKALFERLLELRNDVGLLSEEYDPAGRRFLGNFPQAYSHVALVTTATNLSRAAEGPARRRAAR